jgi:ABC-2 type transport system ATP-binding protein
MAAALEIHDLHKTYRNGFEALKGISLMKGISLSVAEGDFFALLGPNGAGKSTAIGIVCSLVNKSSGRVAIYGHDIDTDLASTSRVRARNATCASSACGTSARAWRATSPVA